MRRGKACKASFAALRLAALVLLGASAASEAVRAAPLEVVATTPDLGELAREVGGEEVSVTVFTKGPQDPHFVEPRPSYIRALHDADLYIQTGMDLEIGWAPVLLRSARNSKVLPGAKGHLDASVVIDPLEVPTGPVDRSMGDVHPYGNPHYLLDPLNGLRVAGLIRDKLIELYPAGEQGFRERQRSFAGRLMERLVGPELAARHDPEELAGLIQAGQLGSFLRQRQEEQLLGGSLGAVRPVSGSKAVEDHKVWAYFARRFGLALVATLEPRPGIAPTTRHLGTVVETVHALGVPLILSSPYFDPRHARWISERTGARVARMAHQVGAREGADDYLATIDYNVLQVLEALRDGSRSAP